MAIKDAKKKVTMSFEWVGSSDEDAEFAGQPWSVKFDKTKELGDTITLGFGKNESLIPAQLIGDVAEFLREEGILPPLPQAAPIFQHFQQGSSPGVLPTPEVYVPGASIPGIQPNIQIQSDVQQELQPVSGLPTPVIAGLAEDVVSNEAGLDEQVAVVAPQGPIDIPNGPGIENFSGIGAVAPVAPAPIPAPEVVYNTALDTVETVAPVEDKPVIVTASAEVPEPQDIPEPEGFVDPVPEFDPDQWLAPPGGSKLAAKTHKTGIAKDAHDKILQSRQKAVESAPEAQPVIKKKVHPGEVER